VNLVEERIGVYICHCGTNIAGTVNVQEVTEFASKLKGVVVAREYKYMCSDPGQDLIKKDIRECGLNRIVVSSCSPLMHEQTFRRVLNETGLNPYLFQMANIREQDSWVTEDSKAATEKAKRLVAAAVRRVSHHEPLEIKTFSVNPNTLVVGGGIAGIEAALRVADSGKKVYLVEKEPTIGGHMAQFDKTFPTLDCAACILTPKMSLVGSNPNIELLAYSEIEGFSGFAGNFKVKIRKKARYVDPEKCTACGECLNVCPVEVPSEFDLGLGLRKAIYMPFPQAVPHTFLISKKETPPCKLACPIHQDVQGYLALIAEGKFKEAYQLIRKTNPLPAVCGRVCYHPCENVCNRRYVDEPLSIAALKRFAADQVDVEEIEIPSITKNGKKVAIIGSGPAGLTTAHDLALMGYDVTIFEAASEPGGMLRMGIPAYRLPRDILSKDIGYIEKLGVQIKTNVKVGKQIRFKELKKKYQAIFLAAGAQRSVSLRIPGEDSEGVIPGLDFLRRVNMGEKVQLGRRVVVVGGGNTAIDAARVAVRLGSSTTILYRRSREEMPASKEEVHAAEMEGVKLTFLVAPKRIIAEKGRISKVECIRMELGPPDASGRRRPIPIEGSEFTIEVDNLIAAIGQTPDLEFVKEIGLELSPAGTLKVDEATLATNLEGVFAGGDVVTGPATVIDAMAAGRKAAQSIDRYLKGEPLAPTPEEVKAPREPSEEQIAEFRERFPVQERIEPQVAEPSARIKDFSEVVRGYDIERAKSEADRCMDCGICSECLECVKACDLEAINHEMKDEVMEIDVGAVIVATGFDVFDPSIARQYGYRVYDNVVTSLEFERMCNASGPTGGKITLKNGEAPKSIAILHCVGSRDENYHEYCSRICCMQSMKFAHLVREKLPDAKVYELYIDIRAFGKGYEEFYKRVMNEEVIFIRGKGAEVTDFAETPEEEGKLIVVCEDTLLGVVRRIPVDMVILSVALEPRKDSDKIAKTFLLSRSRDGFFLERHPKLAPVSTANDGIYIAGACQGPKDIPDSVAQGGAAAAEALSLIDRGKVEVEPDIAVVDENLCSACRVCIRACPFNAIEFDEEKEVAVVQETLCKACGVCVAACPSSAIKQQGFTDKQIYAEVEGILAT